jgi:hypothetical protein
MMGSYAPFRQSKENRAELQLENNKSFFFKKKENVIWSGKCGSQ